MKGQEQSSSVAYEASTLEVQNMIMDWVEATEAFHKRYAKLNELIDKMKRLGRRQASADRTRLRQLMSLRQHMSDVLMTLLLDMNTHKQGRSAMPSKPSQIHSHARLLAELNREIDAQLTNTPVMSVSTKTVAQA